MTPERIAPGRDATGPEAKQLERGQTTESNVRLQVPELGYYRSIKSGREDSTVQLPDLIDAIRSGEFKPKVDPIRDIANAEFEDALHNPDPEVMRELKARMKPLKERLPAVTISGTVTSGGRANAADEGRFQHSGLLQIDIDRIDNPHLSLDNFWDALVDDDRVIAAFASPSGTGMKGIARIPADPAMHLRSFLAVEAHFASLGIKIDAACKDAVRLMYLTHDATAFFDSSRTAAFDPLPEPAPAPPPSKPATALSGGKDGIVLREGGGTYEVTLDDLREMISVIPRPPYQQWLEICSGAWNHFGEAATEILAAHWPEERPGEYAEKFRNRLSKFGVGTVIYCAVQAGWVPPWASVKKASVEAERVTDDDIARKLAVRIFDAFNPPEKPEPVVMLAGQTIGTPGNLMAIQAGIKSGKTAVIGALAGAFMVSDAAGDHDLLGIQASNPEGLAVVHFDTEQSRFDHHRTIDRALSRIGMTAPPSWFRSYSLADLWIPERLAALRFVVAEAKRDFRGLRAVILDGVGDLVLDPNDAAESFEFVGSLHRLAIEHDCLVVVVLHENPGSEKTRGHLGSHLQRKAETNLRLQKDPATGITTVWADFARSCHIPKSHGTCFAWNDQLGMHASCGTAHEIKTTEKRNKAADDAHRIMGGRGAMSHGDLKNEILEVLDVSERTAKSRIQAWKNDGIIAQNQVGKYFLT